MHQGTRSPSATGTGEVSVGVPPSSGDWGGDFHTAPILNLAVGGWAGTPDSWVRQSMLVDWVRVYA